MRRLMFAMAAVAAGGAMASADDKPSKPVKLLIITGDNVSVHDWKGTTTALREVLSAGGKIDVDVTSTPAKDLTDENLAKYDVLLLNYFNTKKPSESPETTWSDANKAAFLKAVRDDGKGLVVIHLASGSFTNPNWVEFEKAVGGWRKQGFHGPPHDFTVKKTAATHPVSRARPPSSHTRSTSSTRTACSHPAASCLPRLIPIPPSPRAPARTRLSSGRTRTARGVSSRTSWATTSPPSTTPGSRPGLAEG